MANLVGDDAVGDAELAVLVEDRWHALVPPRNERMFHTLRRVDTDLRTRDDDGFVRVDLSPPEDAWACMETKLQPDHR